MGDGVGGTGCWDIPSDLLRTCLYPSNFPNLQSCGAPRKKQHTANAIIVCTGANHTLVSTSRSFRTQLQARARMFCCYMGHNDPESVPVHTTIWLWKTISIAMIAWSRNMTVLPMHGQLLPPGQTHHLHLPVLPATYNYMDYLRQEMQF